jgi:hypothetical protein
MNLQAVLHFAFETALIFLLKKFMEKFITTAKAEIFELNNIIFTENSNLKEKFESLLEHINNLQSPNKKINDRIRRIHDFYGWMAKENRIRGLCAGAIYRSEKFLKMKKEERIGIIRNNINIHIEHTIPVSDLVNNLKYVNSSKDKKFNSSSDLHEHLLLHSITAALTHAEKLQMSKARIPQRRNEAFHIDGEKVGDYPFRRYLKLKEYNFKIFNVMSGEEIDLDKFTFSDHKKAIYQSGFFQPLV